MDEEQMKQLLMFLSTLNQQATQAQLAESNNDLTAANNNASPIATKVLSESTEQEKKYRNLAAVTKCKKYKIGNMQRLETNLIELDRRKQAAQRRNEYLRRTRDAVIDSMLKDLDDEENNKTKTWTACDC